VVVPAPLICKVMTAVLPSHVDWAADPRVIVIVYEAVLAGPMTDGTSGPFEAVKQLCNWLMVTPLVVRLAGMLPVFSIV